MSVGLCISPSNSSIPAMPSSGKRDNAPIFLCLEVAFSSQKKGGSMIEIVIQIYKPNFEPTGRAEGAHLEK